MVDVPRTSGTGPLRGYWRSVGLVSIALALLALSFRMGIDSGMATGQVDLTFRYRVYLHEGNEVQAKVDERYQAYAKEAQ